MDMENRSFLPFTEEELEILNFTPEELEILEDAGAIVETQKMLPDDFNEIIKKVDETFKSGEDVTAGEIFEQLGKLCETDPDFVNQLIAAQELLSACRPDDENSETLK